MSLSVEKNGLYLYNARGSPYAKFEFLTFGEYDKKVILSDRHEIERDS